MLRFALPSGFALGLCFVTGCVGDDTNPSLPAVDAAVGVDSSIHVGAVDGAAPESDAGPKASVLAYVRFANWVSDAPAIDFCLAPHGTARFQGPLVARFAAEVVDSGAGDASVGALSFTLVTSYLSVAPGTYDVRVVVGGAQGCSTGIGPDLVQMSALGRETFTTVAFTGDAHPGDGGVGPAVVPFSDDERPSGSTALRFINAAPSIAQAAFGTGSLLKGYKSLFPSVGYGTAPAANDAGGEAGTPIDRNGYGSVSPLVDGTISVHATGATVDDAVATNVSAAAGAVMTVVLLAGGAADAVQLLACVDNAGSIDLLGSCSIVSQDVDAPSRSAGRSGPASQE